jgi:transposase InsO family protein
VQQWIAAVGTKTAYIERGSPWENGYIESFNARLRDELLNGGDLLQFARGPDRHRELATPLQHDQTPRLTWIQATRAGGVHARLRRLAGRATPSGSAGHAGETANLKLTFHLDHSEGADHLHNC